MHAMTPLEGGAVHGYTRVTALKPQMFAPYLLHDVCASLEAGRRSKLQQNSTSTSSTLPACLERALSQHCCCGQRHCNSDLLTCGSHVNACRGAAGACPPLPDAPAVERRLKRLAAAAPVQALGCSRCWAAGTPSESAVAGAVTAAAYSRTALSAYRYGRAPMRLRPLPGRVYRSAKG